MADTPATTQIISKKLTLWLSSFTVLFAIAIVAGYVVGKDRTMRDNARDAAAASTG